MGHLRKPGKVINIRLNPTECLQVLDFLKKAGISTEGKTFSTCASIVLHALMKDAQIRNVLDEPDGFEFNNRMEQFLPDHELAQKTMSGVLPVKENPQEIEWAQDVLQQLVDREES